MVKWDHRCGGRQSGNIGTGRLPTAAHMHGTWLQPPWATPNGSPCAQFHATARVRNSLLQPYYTSRALARVTTSLQGFSWVRGGG